MRHGMGEDAALILLFSLVVKISRLGALCAAAARSAAPRHFARRPGALRQAEDGRCWAIVKGGGVEPRGDARATRVGGAASAGWAGVDLRGGVV